MAAAPEDIKPAGPDFSCGLPVDLGASAACRRAHGAHQPAFDRAFGDFQHLGDLLVGEPFEFRQHQHQPLVLRQGVDRLAGRLPALARLQRLLGVRPVVGRVELELVALLAGFGQLAEAEELQQLAAAQAVVAVVDRDPVEPGRHLALRLEAGGVFVDLEENVLGGVARLLAVAEQAEAELLQAFFVAHHEDAERFDVAGGHPLQHSQIRDRALPKSAYTVTCGKNPPGAPFLI